MDRDTADFYCRYYVGSKGQFGHEFLEYELKADGKLRYANSSKYKNEEMIRREVKVTALVRKEALRIITTSGILSLSDEKWPEAGAQGGSDGRQDLDIRVGGQTYKFSCAKIGSLRDWKDSEDPEGLGIFYYLVQDLKFMFASLISMHVKVKPT
jgi:protein mago nashi